MFRFLCTRRRTLVLHRDFALINSATHLGFVQSTFLSLRLLSSASQAEENEQKQSFVVSYFMKSCGLSLQSAMYASKRLRCSSNIVDLNADKADSVLRLLSEHGFSDIQITKVVRICPLLIVLDPERILLPKIEFFRSKGVSRNQLVKIISSSPGLLSLSLKNRLTPNYNFLKNLLVLDDKVVRVLTRNSRPFLLNFGSTLAPNIALLKEIGMPQSHISFLVITEPRTACCKPSKFCKIVNEVKEMGFNPMRVTFVVAIRVIVRLSKLAWDSKIEIYGRWGWSKDETLGAFKRDPHCMLKSEKKIISAMDFFVNKMGWLSQDIAKMPIVLSFSLEKRIVPRCSVIQVLLSKGLIKEDIRPTTFLNPAESKFIERYVTRFQEKVPQLLNVYYGNIGHSDVIPGFQRYVN